MDDSTAARIQADRELQDVRLKFERDKTAYDQNAEHIRSLNQFLWQVPTIAITLTGGLWFGVTKIDAPKVQQGLLLLAMLSDFLLVFVVFRMRFLFDQYLMAQRGFNRQFEIASEEVPWILPRWTVVRCFALILAAGCLGSAFGLWKFSEIFPSDRKPSVCSCARE